MYVRTQLAIATIAASKTGMIERARKTTDLTSKEAAKKERRRTIVKNLERRVNQYKTLIAKVKGKELMYLARVKKKLMLSRNGNKRITNNKKQY